MATKMLRTFMITRPSRRLCWPVVVAFLVPLYTAACEKVPLLAPSGSTITLTASTTAMPTGGTTDIIAQVLEAAGTAPHSGTLITFTTTLGAIEPAEARTDVGGRVIVRFNAGSANGTAVITATSGAATTGTNGAIKIAVGTAAVGRVSVNANPATVPAAGGSTTITASVLDINGNPLSSAPVLFTSTAGTLSSSIVTTDVNGSASTTLTTSQQATVTASVGAQAPTTGGGNTGGGTGTGGTGTNTSGQASGTVTVNVSNAPTIAIVPPATPPSVGLPASFTFTVTPASQNGSAVREVTVDWGDGDRQNLGAVVGSQAVSHRYNSARTFTISATVKDAAGNVNTVSTAVTVIPVQRPTIIVTATPQNQTVGGTINFNIQVTAASGIGIQGTRIDFGDGTGSDLGGATSANVPHQYTTTGQKTVRVTVLDTTGQTTEGTTTVSITP